MVFQTDHGGRWKRSGQVRTWLWAEKFVCLFTPDCLLFTPIPAMLALLVLMAILALLALRYSKLCVILSYDNGGPAFSKPVIKIQQIDGQLG